MASPNPLERIIYITIPEDSQLSLGPFTIDSSVRLPVELPPDTNSLNIQELSWEMIVSGMLKICAYQPNHEHIDYYRKLILELQPNITAELTQAGIVKAEAREYEIAEEVFLALKHLSPDMEETALNLAFVYQQQMQDAQRAEDAKTREAMEQRAFSAYQDALNQFEDSAEVQYHAGSFFLELENLERAREHFELFLGLTPEDERAPEAQQIIQQISSQDENDRHFAAAFDLMQLGKEEEALEHAESFLAGNPDIWNGWFLKGWALRRLGRYREAEQALEQCASLTKDQTDVFNELAICQMELEKFSECRDSLKKALALEPENVKIISNFGVLALKLGDREQALGFFRAAHEIDPDDPAAKQYLDMLEPR